MFVIGFQNFRRDMSILYGLSLTNSLMCFSATIHVGTSGHPRRPPPKKCSPPGTRIFQVAHEPATSPTAKIFIDKAHTKNYRRPPHPLTRNTKKHPTPHSKWRLFPSDSKPVPTWLLRPLRITIGAPQRYRTRASSRGMRPRVR